MGTQREFVFNDEFFFHVVDRDAASAEFPVVWFAVFSSVMSETFREEDEMAKAMKRSFLRAGIVTITLAVAALSFAAIEPSLLVPLAARGTISSHWVTIAATAAAFCGILSFVLGFFRMGISRRKEAWLRQRLLCERMRQWRWQYFCAHIPEVLDAARDVSLQAPYCNARDAAFLSYIDQLKRDLPQELSKVTAFPKDESDVSWAEARFGAQILAPETIEAMLSPSNETAVQQLMNVYLKIRIGAQRRYAEHLVRDTGRLVTHPRSQQEILHKFGHGIVIVILVLHVAILCGVFAGLPLLKSAAVHVSAVVLALVALGFKAVEEGLRPAEHLGRLTGYLAEIRTNEQDFQASVRRRRYLMHTTEKASFNEMVDFLRSAQKSRYIM